MSYINDFLLIVLSAIVLQNAVFTRGLGSSKDTVMMSSPKKIFFFGATVTLITFFSALLAWPINYLLRENKAFVDFMTMRYILSLACVCIVYIAFYLVSKYFLPTIHYGLRRFLSGAAFNCAVLGSILIAFSGSYSLSKTIGFAFGSGVGYTLALLLLHEGKRRIMLSDIPRSFCGFPIMLLYLGILSLAIYGLIGHQLPT